MVAVRDLAFIGFLVALFGMGFRRPFLFVLAYVYIDLVSPQRLTYLLLNSVPISLIAVVFAVGGWVLADDKRMDHIKSWEDLGEHWKKETTYYWEHYKDLKKPGTCSVNGFFGTEKAVEIIKSCEARYMAEIDPKLVD